LTRGGTYHLYDFVPDGQGENYGKTLAIFNTSEEVMSTKTPDARQFGPSVIAPFLKFTILGDAMYTVELSDAFKKVVAQQHLEIVYS
jgi:hypothetical protein